MFPLPLYVNLSPPGGRGGSLLILNLILILSRSVGMTILISLLLLAAQDDKTVKVGAQAPEFKVKDSAGKDIDLAELTKKGTVLVRLTCGCLGCDQEIKYFKALQDTYKPLGLNTLAIFKEPDVKVEKYAQDKQ